MIAAAVTKDVALLLRDRGALISLFLLPIVFIVVFGSMFRFGGDSGKPRPIAVWYAAGGPGEKIVKTLDATPGFRAEVLASADDVRAGVAKETYPAGLIVPARGLVELSIDLGAPVQVRGPVEGALTGVVMRALAPVDLSAMPPLVEAVTPPGIASPMKNISSFQVTVPGNAVLFGFFIALTVAMAFTGERRTGTWRRLLAAPVPRSHALLATLIPYYLVGITQLAFLFGIGAAAFGMQVAGSLAALVVLSLAVSLCAVSLGFLMAAIGGSEKQLGGIGSVVLLVMGMLGGCMFPRAFMPQFMKSIGLGVPHGWALDGYYAVLVREGTTVADVAPSIAALLAFAALFAGLGLALFRFER
ncbi:MAG: ABC transporter permease [Deltaproteobacteria bacterium]|nr:ABC transporter permease [Deltaproteobacteria bacterium]